MGKDTSILQDAAPASTRNPVFTAPQFQPHLPPADNKPKTSANALVPSARVSRGQAAQPFHVVLVGPLPLLVEILARKTPDSPQRVSITCIMPQISNHSCPTRQSGTPGGVI